MERSPFSRSNHQVAGSNIQPLAERDRQILARNRAEQVAEAPQSPVVISADHIVRMMVRTADRLPLTR